MNANTPPGTPIWTRRRLLRAGAAGGTQLLLPWLAACGGDASDPSAEPGTPTMPDTPSPPPVPDVAPPRGIHLSWTADPYSSRTATWFADGASAHASRIEYGSVLAGMSETDIASAPFEYQSDADASETPGVDAWTYRAHAAGIDPERPMRYRVGSDSGGWSPVQLVNPSSRGRFRFAHIGDHGVNADSQSVSTAVAQAQPDFVFIAGDLSYANGDQPVWDDYFDRLQVLAARSIVMTAAGNHEEEDNGGRTYKNRLSMPAPPAGGPGAYYSFDYENVHFLVSTGGALVRDLTLPAELLFIETDLAQAALRRAAGEIDFIVFIQHFTLWTDQEGRAPNDPTLVLLEEQFIVRYGVDLLVVGHDHVYQRSQPMRYGRPDAAGYVQVCSGCGGQSLRGFEPEIQDWSAAEVVRLLYTEYEVEGPVMRARAIAADNEPGVIEVLDAFEIRRRDSNLINAAASQPIRNLTQILGQLTMQSLEKAIHDRNKHLLTYCAGFD